MGAHPEGTCRYCGDTDHTGPHSTVCVACCINPKHRERMVKLREEQEADQ